MMPKRKPAIEGPARPWTLDYGLTQGHCKSPESAKSSVLAYMQKHGLKHVNIEDRVTGKKVADAWRSGAWGFMIVPAKHRDNVLALVKRSEP